MKPPKKVKKTISAKKKERKRNQLSQSFAKLKNVVN